MSKYYVQCGSVELVIARETSECAAIAIIDRILAPHLWIYDDPKLSDRQRLQHLMVEALLHLPTEILVSERGFGRPDCNRVSVPEAIQSWHAMVVGFTRMFYAMRLDRGGAAVLGSGDGKDRCPSSRTPR